jgi:hypothetical protein
LRRSRFFASDCRPAAGAILLVLAVAECPSADPVLEALADEVDLAEAAALLGDLLDQAQDDPAELIETILRDAAALRAEPLDVNRASFSDLVRVPFIDAAVAAAIVARRDADGPFRSLDELEGVAGIPRRTVSAVRPYLFVGSAESVGHAAVGGGDDAGAGAPRRSASGGAVDAEAPALRWSLRVRAACRASELQESGGDVLAASATTMRLRVSGGRALEIGVGCQKDAREPAVLDHSAFFVSWRRDRGQAAGETPNVSIIAGDFVGDWAQGIVLSGSGFGSARALPRIRDRTRGYDGASESLARRGLVLGVRRGRAAVLVVGARTRLDAAIGEDGRATTIRSSGYHRTEGERRGANALLESLVGARGTIGVSNGLEFGASFLRFRYDHPLASGDLERQRFRFEGSELEILSADVRLAGEAWRLGMEVAGASGGGSAAVACARVRRGAAAVRLGFGYLSRSYWSPVGGGIPGSSSGQNGVSGWIGAEYRAAPRVRPWIALTLAGRPWRSYSDELPGGFRVWSAGVALPVGRLGDLAVEGRERTEGAGRGDPPASVEEVCRRVRATFRASGGAPLAFFLERVTSSAEGVEEGSAVAFGARADIELSPSVSVAVGATQVARRGSVRPLVAYEPSLPGEFSLRSLSESGARWYARLAAGLTPRCGLTLRAGGGPGPGRSEIGISLDTRGS